MPRRCTICDHDEKDAINHALLGSEPQRVIAGRYGVEQSSLSRHKTGHLGPAVANALAKAEELDAGRLTAWLVGVNEQTLLGVLRTKADQDWPAFRALVAEVRKNVELLGRLSGILDAGPAVHIDARKTAVLGSLEEADLRELAAAAREGRLDAALAGRVALPVGNGDGGP